MGEGTQDDVHMEYLVGCEIVVELSGEPTFRYSVGIDQRAREVKQCTEKEPRKAQFIVQSLPSMGDKRMTDWEDSKQAKGCKCRGSSPSVFGRVELRGEYHRRGGYATKGHS